jgi:hypothetical protein
MGGAAAALPAAAGAATLPLRFLSGRSGGGTPLR